MNIIKTFILLSGLFLFSCTPVRYLSKPTYQWPCIELEEDIRILIAKDKMIMPKMIESDKCFEGILSNIERYEQIKIVEVIDFHKKVDSITLMQLKDKYDVVGLLLLINIYDQPMNQINKEPSSTCAGCPPNYSLDYDNSIISTWEYFDFRTGETFGYTIENSKSGKWKSYLQSPEDINNVLLQIKEQLLVENGKQSLNKLIGF